MRNVYDVSIKLAVNTDPPLHLVTVLLIDKAHTLTSWLELCLNLLLIDTKTLKINTCHNNLNGGTNMCMRKQERSFLVYDSSANKIFIASTRT